MLRPSGRRCPSEERRCIASAAVSSLVKRIPSRMLDTRMRRRSMSADWTPRIALQKSRLSLCRRPIPAYILTEHFIYFLVCTVQYQSNTNSSYATSVLYFSTIERRSMVCALSEGSEVKCSANGIPPSVVRWEALNQNQTSLRRIYILSNQTLHATLSNASTSPGEVQSFRCRATQQIRGRGPIEMARDFQCIVMRDTPTRKPYDGLNCEQMPNAPGCGSRESRGPLILVLIVASSLIVCVVLLAGALLVAFLWQRHQWRLFGRHHQRQQQRHPPVVQFSRAPDQDDSGQWGVRLPQYAESDPPREPLVVTAELPDRDRSDGEWPPPNAPMQPSNRQSIETLLTPPDYDSATHSDVAASSPVPPPYAPVADPKAEENVEEH